MNRRYTSGNIRNVWEFNGENHRKGIESLEERRVLEKRRGSGRGQVDHILQSLHFEMLG